MQGTILNFTGRMLDHYLLQQHIGEGGMSVVYLARQTDLPRLVAVKILFPQAPVGSSMYGEFLERFRREAQLIATLEHTNIVVIHDYKEQADMAYLVMPYFPRGSLAHLLEQQGSLSLHKTLLYIEQAAAALDYAHKRGVIHRDLKPSNFLLHTDGHLVLADFGIAHMMRTTSTTFISQPEVVLGTPQYMAPEMIYKQPVDYHADIYELGIVLFQMLSGHVPFEGNMLMKHLQEPMPLLHRIDPAIPPRVDEVIGKATAKRPQDRYHTAGELASDLRIAIEGIGLQSAPTVFAARHASTPPLLPQMPRTEEVPVPPPLPVRSIPSTPKMPPRRGGRRPSVWPLVVALILFALVGGMLVTTVKPPGNAPPSSGSTPPPVSTVSTLDPRQAVVKDYYDNIDRHDYRAAYLAWQNHPDEGYGGFVNAFASTETDKVTFDGVPQPGDQGTYNVPITLQATEQFPEGVRESVYKGYQTVVLENGSWKITGGDLPLVVSSSPTPLILPAGTPSDQGKAVVQQFYDDVNRQDYPAAYVLWGNAFRQQRSYYDFVQGYTGTKHNALTFGTILPQPDGTVVVPVTITATEETPSGMRETVYNGTYVVGQEQGLWKLQSGRLQQSS
jgi:serine/threonine protein kinase